MEACSRKCFTRRTSTGMFSEKYMTRDNARSLELNSSGRPLWSLVVLAEDAGLKEKL
jgi:hypothetical protein